LIKIKDITGRKFGRLTVLERVEDNKWGHTCWLCKCDCGTYKIIVVYSLTSGNTKSCGCLQKDRIRETSHKRRLPKGVAARNFILRRYKRGAKKRGIEYNMTDEQMMEIMSNNCHYCGAHPSNICSPNHYYGSYIYNGIDRKDNKKGYTIDNVVSCCWECNYFKKERSYNEFLDLISRIHSYLNL